MLRSMYTSISGLRNHQAALDVTANNIANVNTYGFKASRMAFKDMLSQTIQGASSPTATMGGTNPRSVGLGMQIDSIQQLHTQGNLQTTGVLTDLAVQGDGFFRVTNDSSQFATGTVPVQYSRAGNFVFDAAGDLVTSDGFHVIGYANAGGPLSAPYQPDMTTIQAINIPPNNSRAISIGQNGRVDYIDNSGQLVTAGWISMSKFPNPAGLAGAGSNKWIASNNSGAEIQGTAGDNTGLGTIVSGTLEMSNVDLATEFTEMIKAQRGFQANTRTITTSDEILQELVNLKR